MKIGPYQVTGSLGRGGAGHVYRARSPDGQEVAVKVLLAMDPGRRARFDRERRLLGAFGEADGFVPLLDSGETREGPYLVMPIVAGGALRGRLEGGRMTVAETIALGRALAGALARAHAKGIVHRDVKPENVLFTPDDRPLIADLGLGKHFDPTAPGASQSADLSRRGEARGTFGYMPPEQMTDARSVGPEADVFALGAILHECLAGKPAFAGEDRIEVLRNVADGKRASLARECPAAPRWLVSAIDRALAPAPAERFEDASRLLAALTPAPRSRALPALALLALLLAVAVVVAWALRAPPLALRLLSPQEGLVTTHASVLVAAATSEAVSAELVLAPGEGERIASLPLDAVGRIETTVWLPPGPTTLEVRARNARGTVVAARVHVERRARPESEAVRAKRHAAEAGNTLAMAELASMLQKGEGVEKDESEALRWLRLSADAGNDWGIFQLGEAFEHGWGTEKDLAKAAELYRRSALLGNVGGMVALGSLHRDGRGVPRDEAAAVEWFRRGGERGSSWGMVNQGEMLEAGRGVAKDEVEAVRCYRRAAELDNNWARYRLGVMLEQGRGVTRDVAEATRLYRVAAARGIEPARQALRRLGAD
ncbi:MAG TPA: serine/threonine-protein kinase [Planctomycetota bacterium]|nr:serine/threonine-protein kinase [Planctomycetota bacterium]